VRRAARWSSFILLLFFLIVATPLAYYAGAPLRERVEPRKSDAIVLFSSGQIDNDWLTGDAAQRTLAAIMLYRSGFGPVIVSSGSVRRLGFREAEIQGEWLQRAGVPPAAIVVENRSGRTYESVVAMRGMMRERGWRSVVVVTSELDVPRIRLVCRRLGVEGVSYLAAPEVRRPMKGSILYIRNGLPVFYHALYEYAALVLYRLKGWI